MPQLEFGDSLYRITGRPMLHEEVGFEVYLRYLKNFTSYIIKAYPKIDDLIANIWTNLSDVKYIKDFTDIKNLRRFLFIAWNTEYLLSVNDKNKDTEILRVNNQWKPIQAYYSVYSLSEAVILTIDHKVESHATCLKKLANFL